MLANDWDTEQLIEWGLDLPDYEEPKVEGLTDEDDVPELPPEPVTKLGDLWLLGEHRLLCGDSTSIDDVEKLMNGKKADLVWTDPPYNVAINGNAGKILNDDMSDNQFKQFMSAIYTNYYCVMRDGAVIYVAHADSERVTFTDEFVKFGLKLSQILIWAKHSATLSRQDFNWKHEPLIYGWKEGKSHYFCKDFTLTTLIDDSLIDDSLIDDSLIDDIDYKKFTKPQLISEIRKIKQNKHDNSTIIKYDRPTKSELHPTMKPVGLVEMMINWSSKDNELVLDLFGGSGTTLMACQKSNRKALIMELDPKYCDVIVKRWQKYIGKQAILESTKQTFNELLLESSTQAGN
jgi:DNA modification methylase